MEIVIVALQNLCVAGLALGTMLSLYPLMRGTNDKGRFAFNYAIANDFETGYRRRAARNRRP
jgi:hypothetical protein